jgi:hypothetical protein
MNSVSECGADRWSARWNFPITGSGAAHQPAYFGVTSSPARTSGLRHAPAARFLLCCAIALGATMAAFAQDTPPPRFDGKFYKGEGNVAYLQLLDIARRMFAPDPEFQNVPMLYTPAWNGFVEGPTWGAWWIQNSYGPTYCALPFYTEPLVTFLLNANDLWFSQMGDGKRAGNKDWVAPDGCLCDAASPGSIWYKQGDGRTDIHDWAVEFTAAGILMQAEALLIQRDPQLTAHYLPLLERSANFIESRCDRNNNNLFLCGPAANLLGPSYAGWQKPDGTFDKAYLAGLSITYIAAMNRMIEVAKLAGQPDKASIFAERRDRARNGLPSLMTNEGYFIKSIDPDGTRHGVYGAAKYGYFESSPNHDAIAFRVVDDQQAQRIYDMIASIPGLRRHDVIVANEPGLDDMYEAPTSWLWQDGTWVNGGHWSTCEARMVLGYFRLGKFDDARRSMEHMLPFARAFRLDNPLVDFGNAVYQPKEPVNLCYDSFGPMAAMVRGLFEYLYSADDLTLIPHIPPGISRLEQNFPIRFGAKRVYIAVVGEGDINAVRVNGLGWSYWDTQTIRLPYAETPDAAMVVIGRGLANLDFSPPFQPSDGTLALPDVKDPCWAPGDLFKNPSENHLALRIGADSNGEHRFKGLLGRVRLFNRPLTNEEIAALPPEQSHAGERDPALLADWSMDRLRDGVVPNPADPTLALAAKAQIDLADTPQGKTARLTGQTWLEAATDPKFELPGGLTIDAWIDPDAVPDGGMRVVDHLTAGKDDGYLLDLMPGGAVRFITPSGALTADSKMEPGAWKRISAAYDPKGSMRLFVDGQPVGERNAQSGPGVVAPGRWRVFYDRCVQAKLADSYEACHARLICESYVALLQRRQSLAAGKIAPLAEASQAAADQSYADTYRRLSQGLAAVLDSYAASELPARKQLYELYMHKDENP